MCRNISALVDAYLCVEYAMPVMASWPFRVSNLVHLLLSFLGSIFLSRALFFRIPYFPVHQNLKLISYFFVTNLLLNSLFMLFATSHILMISFSFKQPCEAFLPRSSYHPVHSVIAFTSYAQTWFQLAFLVERSVATRKAAEYETWSRKLGWALVISALFMTLIGYVYVFGFFDPKIFEGLEVSYVFWPDATKMRFNHTLTLSIGSSLIGLILCCFLYKYNKEEKQKEVGCCLSKRYQVSENVRATEFVLCVSITTTAVFIFSSIFVLSVRLSYNSIFEENIVAYSTARSACYPMPALSILIPLSVLAARNRQVTSVEIMEKTAEAMEYARILQKQWEK